MKISKLFFLFTFIAATAALTSCNAQSNQVDAKTFAAKIKEGNVTLVDVRTPDEYNSGHIANATNIDIYSNTFMNQIGALPKDKTVMVYCRSGSRSAQAAAKLRQMGYTVMDLAGGIGSWSGAGMPLVR